MKITRKQIRRIIKEEKARLQEQSRSEFSNRSGYVYSALEDIVMSLIGDEQDFMSPEDWSAFEASVAEAMIEMKDRILDPRLRAR